jgi:hypothetical protein
VLEALEALGGDAGAASMRSKQSKSGTDTAAHPLRLCFPWDSDGDADGDADCDGCEYDPVRRRRAAKARRVEAATRAGGTTATVTTASASAAAAAAAAVLPVIRLPVLMAGVGVRAGLGEPERTPAEREVRAAVLQQLDPHGTGSVTLASWRRWWLIRHPYPVLPATMRPMIQVPVPVSVAACMCYYDGYGARIATPPCEQPVFSSWAYACAASHVY